MRHLTKNETAAEGDWFFIFWKGEGWIRLDNRPKPLFRKTIQELEDEHGDEFYYPIIIVRPNIVEYLFKTYPSFVPEGVTCRHNVEWTKCRKCYR